MNALRRLISWLFRGHDSGQSMVEYLILVGACALVGIAGFNEYGKSVKRDLSADAKHIEGEGLPNTEGILGSLGVDYNELPGWCVKPNYCFAAGTPVETERGDRAIESIHSGDRVWARDVTTGAIALRSVVNTYRTARVPVIDLELSVGRVATEHLAVTRGHLFWVEGPGWVRADALGARALWSTEGAIAAQPDTDLLDDSEPTTVYNLEVSEFHSYFVGQSHVLVHNGDPDGTACTPLGGGRKRLTMSAGLVQCGEAGSYYYDLGGWDKKKKGLSRYGPGLQRDHIPSRAALVRRATQLMEQAEKALMGNRCAGLDEVQSKELADKKARALAELELQTFNEGFSVVEPTKLHAKTRSFSNENTKEQIEGDSANLPGAVGEDLDRIVALLDGNVVTDPMLTPECEAKLRASIATIRKDLAGVTQDDYDAKLTVTANNQLKASGFIKYVETKCEPKPLAAESAAN